MQMADPARRRWDDQPGALPALTFARFLTTSPTIGETMRFLVGLLSWPVGAYGAILICPHDDGIANCAHFEQSIDDTATTPDPAEVERDVVALVRETAGTHPVIRTDSDPAERTPMAAWPLGLEGGMARVLVLLLAAPMDPVVFAQRTVGVPEGLGVYLAGATSFVGLPRCCSVPPPAGVSLTRRQQQVLDLLEEGLTLHQIAGRIGFSESTVRMESLAIYRALDVHDRANAVAAARDLGLLPAAVPPDLANVESGLTTARTSP